MRLVLDQGLSRDAASCLRNLGHECAHVGEVGMHSAADEDILAFSLKLNAIVITLDADFHAILAVSGASGPSVVRLRLQGLGGPGVAEVVQRVLLDFDSDLRRGALITVKMRKTTCHRLPVGLSD